MSQKKHKPAYPNASKLPESPQELLQSLFDTIGKAKATFEAFNPEPLDLAVLRDISSADIKLVSRLIGRLQGALNSELIARLVRQEEAERRLFLTKLRELGVLHSFEEICATYEQHTGTPPSSGQMAALREELFGLPVAPRVEVGCAVGGCHG